MLSMTTVAAGTAGASGGSQPLFNKVFLYTFVASLLGVVIGTFLIGSATVVNIVIALLVMGACPVLGRALGAGNIGEGNPAGRLWGPSPMSWACLFSPP